jgi:hypothetical protein
MTRNTDPSPICDHAFTEPDHEDEMHRVTNEYRSCWVCHRRPCILDAMAWVERGNSGPAIVYDTSGVEVAV